jgi:protein-tyrosine phosphatase
LIWLLEENRDMRSERIHVLFICLGNICRSPLAEAVFRAEVRSRGLEEHFEIDSAGTSSYHSGCGPDRRSVETARRRGVAVEGTARQITDEDLHRCDYVIVMDSGNFADVDQLKAAADGSAVVRLLREWDPDADSLDVPDPYYGGAGGFDRVHDIIERSCRALLDSLVGERVGR